MEYNNRNNEQGVSVNFLLTTELTSKGTEFSFL